MKSRLQLSSYDIIGGNPPTGIRYVWKLNNIEHHIESASFINKSRGISSNISGYTTSVSAGCILKSLNLACKFCRTGKLLPFSAMLTAAEIAKQNVMMVLADLNCSDNINLKNNRREFAYMGQGEPGYSYQQLRLAILLTNLVMEHLNQDVYRHIISTSGVLEILDSIESDICRDYYKSKVTIHYSLHSCCNRNLIIPLELVYPYKNFIVRAIQTSKLSNEKISLGVLLFNNLKVSNSIIQTTVNDFRKIVKIANPVNYRFSLCKYNNSNEIGSQSEYPQYLLDEILNLLHDNNYEVKIFESFGENEDTACGLLAGKAGKSKISKKWKELEEYADELIGKAILYTQSQSLIPN